MDRCCSITPSPSFGREVQALYLHTNVQETMSIIKEPAAAISQANLIDSKLQRFFSDVMSQSGSALAPYCGSLVFTIGYACTPTDEDLTDISQRLI